MTVVHFDHSREPEENHEEDGAAPFRDVSNKARGLFDQVERLLQVDDVDAAPLGEDVAAHLRVPASRLVAEMDSGLQKLAHRNDRQN